MMDRILEMSPAKINLFFKFISKRNDGYHDIRSSVTLINLYDEILVEKSSFFEVKYIGKFAPKNNKFKDCIIEKLFKQIDVDRPKYKFIIKKNIPVQSGLGSASSNVASVLHILEKLEILKIKNNFNFISLGADVPLFFFKKDCLIRKRGDQIIEKIFPKYHFLLIKPSCNFATKEMYKKITSKHIDYRIKNDINEINEFDVGNDFEKIVNNKNHQIAEIFNFFEKFENIIFYRMTGSGSCCYATFKERKHALFVQKSFQKLYPELWTFVAENNLLEG